jgi:hypothetical protein
MGMPAVSAPSLRSGVTPRSPTAPNRYQGPMDLDRIGGLDCTGEGRQVTCARWRLSGAGHRTIQRWLSGRRPVGAAAAGPVRAEWPGQMHWLSGLFTEVAP